MHSQHDSRDHSFDHGYFELERIEAGRATPPEELYHGTLPERSASEPLLSTKCKNIEDDALHPISLWLLRKLPSSLSDSCILIMARLSSSSWLLRQLETSSEPGLMNAHLMLTNYDLKPVEPARRLWGTWNFINFWIADSFNINTWMISSSMITTNGLSWWQAWICVWVGYLIAACFVCLTGRIGAMYHVPFPVVARASFGIWGSLWPVLNRTLMACVWSVSACKQSHA